MTTFAHSRNNFEFRNSNFEIKIQGDPLLARSLVRIQPEPPTQVNCLAPGQPLFSFNDDSGRGRSLQTVRSPRFGRTQTIGLIRLEEGRLRLARALISRPPFPHSDPNSNANSLTHNRRRAFTHTQTSSLSWISQTVSVQNVHGSQDADTAAPSRCRASVEIQSHLNENL